MCFVCLQCCSYEIGDRKLTPVALAYVRARHADPLCSFGDFAAVRPRPPARPPNLSTPARSLARAKTALRGIV